jgi:NitT/TauT family transport system substrate-binding protein
MRREDLSVNQGAERRMSQTLLLALLCLFCGDVAAESAPTSEATVAIIGVSSSIWPALVAEKKGFFAKEGLRVDVITAGSSALVLQDIAAGAAEIGSSSLVDTFRAVNAGADLKLFLASQVVGPYRLIAAKGIKSVADLKGKKIVTGGAKDITNFWWETIAKHYGLDPLRDVQVFYSGSSASRASALLAGGVDAAILSTPQTFQLSEQGYGDLGSAARYLGEFPTMGWAVNTKWAAAHQPVVVAFIRAHDEAVSYMMNPAHKQEVAGFLAKAANLSLGEADQTWDVSARDHAFASQGAIPSSALSLVQDTLISQGDLEAPPKPIAYFYDGSFAKEAASGSAAP